MTYKECRTCGDYLEVNPENYYYKMGNDGKYRFNSPDCKACYTEKDREQRRLEKLDEDYMGLNAVKPKPGSWGCPIQKEQTFQFLTLMGWKYNAEKNLWYDDIKKDKDGNFIGIWAKENLRRKVKTKLGDFVQVLLTKETFKPYVFKDKVNGLPRDTRKDEMIQNIIKDYFLDQIPLDQIRKKYNVTTTYIHQWAASYNRQQGESRAFRKVTNPRMRKPHKNNRQPLPICDIPELTVTKEEYLKYPKEYIRQIQIDYFTNTMKQVDVITKYGDDGFFAQYVIIRTIQTIKKNGKK